MKNLGNMKTLKEEYKRKIIELTFIIIFLVIIMIGMSCNFIVIQKNNGKMPVHTYYILDSEGHFSYQNSSEINYWFLSDMIKINNLKASLGDIFMGVGISGIFAVIFRRGVKKIIKLKSQNLNIVRYFVPQPLFILALHKNANYHFFYLLLQVLILEGCNFYIKILF